MTTFVFKMQMRQNAQQSPFDIHDSKATTIANASQRLRQNVWLAFPSHAFACWPCICLNASFLFYLLTNQSFKINEHLRGFLYFFFTFRLFFMLCVDCTLLLLPLFPFNCYYCCFLLELLLLMSILFLTNCCAHAGVWVISIHIIVGNKKKEYNHWLTHQVLPHHETEDVENCLCTLFCSTIVAPVGNIKTKKKDRSLSSSHGR